eukprot:CAMPEP_0178395926 /NCGR_PEP_ID=MMETSP0689_2-20121128/13468_1 /TAXON_ID=160604 /ORGANISM="Amphidinium massartii, Strain CS-259" /LENGTH=815 /DNA_ID=CAMNT_0020016591 /DNA_START=21 /DNA_END=2465 /DNA_ORIENTATION=+
MSLRRVLLICSVLFQQQAAPAWAWNSEASLQHFYTFQDFYTDAQYGPDFGYYSTGRILHEDGERQKPADQTSNDTSNVTDKQEWFNSYTTLPMSLSPFFSQMLCERLVGMWRSMGQPSPIHIFEFGGGTGMLARDLLQHARRAFPAFYEALGLYTIGERSVALRGAQQRTAAEFKAAGKLMVVDADARHASQAKELLELPARHEGRVVGFVISNELLDEFDPVRLRLVWHTGHPPSEERCRSCKPFREVYVMHRIDDSALVTLLLKSASQLGGSVAAYKLAEKIRWEGRTHPCGLLGTVMLQRLISSVTELLTPQERTSCSPMQVCCTPFLLAVDQLLQLNISALQQPHHMQWRVGAVEDLLGRYREQINRTNGTVTVTRSRYQELRRLASQLGPDVELSLLTGQALTSSGLPGQGHLQGRMYSDEVLLALSAARCEELTGWRKRHAKQLAEAAIIRDVVAPQYDIDPGLQCTRHLSVVVRPGEAEFVKQAADLLDEGFMVSIDYGADAEALVWQSLVHPNFPGIHTMDARWTTASLCTDVSHLACPGLQDLTTSVDFTEVAAAGEELGAWQVMAYGPLFFFETGFDKWLPDPTAHLMERAGGPRTVALHAWYRKADAEPWASFKVLVQHRGDLGKDWTLGPPGLDWQLGHLPQSTQQSSLLSTASPCWTRDIAKPPFAARVAQIAEEVSNQTAGVARKLIDGFGTMLRSASTLSAQIQDEHHKQKQAYRDMHLAMLLTDYWYQVSWLPGVSCGYPATPEEAKEWIAEIRQIADHRQLTHLYGEEMLQRVLTGVAKTILGLDFLSTGRRLEPYQC